MISERKKFRAEFNFRKSLKSAETTLEKNYLIFLLFKCFCLFKLSSRILSMVDPKYSKWLERSFRPDVQHKEPD